jgi:hypothetical protein
MVVNFRPHGISRGAQANPNIHVNQKKKKNKAITLLNTATLQHHHKNPRSFDKKDESIQEVKSFHNIMVN